ncbi:hypothetical protein QSV38_02245 [Streptococcus parasuis]|uniref:hypothetical protein n=1 Tax=Streptococcus parasuis TaxID=1501662 RepID=UPI0025A614DD|nr:hypothetical protein [Streptococcus parasuis]WJQ86104.1 hypothetical protein QSV38_02245 [Streptococcus parasuis]
MILTFILFFLKVLGVIKVSWFIVFVPFLIVLGMIAIFIGFILFVNSKIKKEMKLSGHDIRMKEMDRNFQKAKSDYEIHKAEFDEKMNRLKGGMK